MFIYTQEVKNEAKKINKVFSECLNKSKVKTEKEFIGLIRSIAVPLLVSSCHLVINPEKFLSDIKNEVLEGMNIRDDLKDINNKTSEQNLSEDKAFNLALRVTSFIEKTLSINDLSDTDKAVLMCVVAVNLLNSLCQRNPGNSEQFLNDVKKTILESMNYC